MKIRFDRLKRLAEHLRSKKLGHVKFDFNNIHKNGSTLTIKQREEGFCGTAGCAMGELPVIFPAYWRFDGSVIVLKSFNKTTDDMEQGNNDWNHEAIRAFFGTNQERSRHLFWPTQQYSDWLHPSRKGKFLGNKATKESVAQNIEWFIKNKGFTK